MYVGDVQSGGRSTAPNQDLFVHGGSNEEQELDANALKPNRAPNQISASMRILRSM